MSVLNLASSSHFTYTRRLMAGEPSFSWIPGLSKRPPLQTWTHLVMEFEYGPFSFLCGNI